MAWSDKIIQQVWEKGWLVSTRDANEYRKDTCGAWMKHSMYGDNSARQSFGWEIDRIDPNGGDGLENLQPLQWENNRGKAADCPGWDCVIAARGEGNIYMQ